MQLRYVSLRCMLDPFHMLTFVRAGTECVGHVPGRLATGAPGVGA